MNKKEVSKIYKILSGIITFLVAVVILLIAFVPSVGKVIVLTILLSIGVFLLVAFWWVLWQGFEGYRGKL